MTSEQNTSFFGHPTGLAILFFTEMWERFSYYGMRAILVLYIVSSVDEGGLGWAQAEALALYGTYTMMVYVMGIPGGWIADNLLGQKKTVMLGGLLLCLGHGILAIENSWSFYTGLILIVLGVGGLKPNISTMVGGLYKQGDVRRDQGFTIFYIGINVGAFISALIVGYVGEKIGWHYGFGLAGIGMILGQIIFVYGQKYLKGVGDLVLKETGEGSNKSKSLTPQEKDRVVVLLISFLIIIVFWGCFEQAGGLMNIYTKDKINRVVGGFEIPASVFQSVNALFIMLFGGVVAAFWANRKKMGNETSSLLKMAIGTIIMGFGFLAMTAASVQAGEPYTKASLFWLILAYFLHTIGELCASPVALSFITKLAPVKYASLMMGLYFAATGFGNKLAGFIGESSRTEPIEVNLIAQKTDLQSFTDLATAYEEGKDMTFRTNLIIEGETLIFKELASQKEITAWLQINNHTLLQETIKDISETPLHVTINFTQNIDTQEYKGVLIVEEMQSKMELKTFTMIAVFAVGFGILLLVFFKKLKKLTHGIEDEEK